MMYLRLKIKKLSFIIILFLASVQLRAQDTLVSAFFGLDNDVPMLANLICAGAQGMDGMPVNFRYPIEATSLSETDFEVIDSLGNIHTPLCAVLAPANEDGENRTVLLFGEFGDADTKPPVEVRIVGDLFTMDTLSGESACSAILNLKGATTTNVVPLSAGPSLFFAQGLNGVLSECSPGLQTIQVAWNGGVVPFISGDQESDLFQYYRGYSDSAGTLIPHIPVAISDINDNDNFHQLCFSTTERIVKISMAANTVEDPNQDPNSYTEVNVTYCMNSLGVVDDHLAKPYRVYPNPFSEEIFLKNLLGNESFVLHDSFGRCIAEGKCSETIAVAEAKPGLYFLAIRDGGHQVIFKLLKR